MNRHKQFKILRESPLPLYVQLKQIIKHQIAEGTLKEEAPIPSERELCKIYNISHITVRQALVELTREGFLFRVPGRGTFVKGRGKQKETQLLPIALVIPESENGFSSPFVFELIRGVKSVITKHNYSLLIYTEGESEYLIDSSTGKIKGIILTDPRVKDTRIVMLKKKGIAQVIIGRAEEENVYSVDNDNFEVGYKLTEHLIESGCKKIGFINSSFYFTVSQDRLEGYKDALKRNNISFDETIVKYGDFPERSGYENGIKLLEKGVDGILCCDDFTSLGVLKAAKEKKIKIPQEVKIAGCNNSPFTSHTHPPLTTFDIFPYKIGKIAAEKIIKLLKGEKTEERTIVKGELIIRKSTQRR